MFDQVAGCATSAFPGPELGAARRAEDGSALVQDAAHVVRRDPTNGISTIDEALQALVDREHVQPGIQSGPNHGTDCGVHSCGITAAGEHGEAGRSLGCPQHGGLPDLGQEFSSIARVHQQARVVPPQLRRHERRTVPSPRAGASALPTSRGDHRTFSC